jgi:hypothetical protein
MDTLAWVVALVATVLAGAWVHTETRWRWRWQQVPKGKRPAGPAGGVYRPALEVPTFRQRAPRDIRLAALGAIATAQLLAVAMLAFFAIFARQGSLGEVSSMAVLLWSPSLIVAIRLVGDGLGLLRREVRPTGISSSGLALWALLFYVALLFGMLLLLELLSTLVRFPADAPGQGFGQLATLMLLLFAWPLAAVGQARILERVAAKHDADLL